MVMGKLSVTGVLLSFKIVGQGLPLSLSLSLFPSLSLCEAVRYRLKYCVKGPLNPKQATDQIKNVHRLFKIDFIPTRANYPWSIVPDIL